MDVHLMVYCCVESWHLMLISGIGCAVLVLTTSESYGY